MQQVNVDKEEPKLATLFEEAVPIPIITTINDHIYIISLIKWQIQNLKTMLNNSLWEICSLETTLNNSLFMMRPFFLMFKLTISRVSALKKVF